MPARAALLILGLMLVGCSAQEQFDRGIYSANLEEIRDLRALMNKHGVPYKNATAGNGMEGFMYRSADQPRISLLREKLGRQTSVNYKEPEAREYMQKLLTDMHEDFIVSVKPDGTWIKWFPESEPQEKEVGMKVVEHMFDLQAKAQSPDCRSSKAPSNDTLATATRREAPRAAQCER